MNLKKLLATSLMSALLVGTVATSAHAEESSSSSSSTTTCLPDGAADTFPTWIENEPTVRAGVNMWHDTGGWHVRVNHATRRHTVYSGKISTEGQLNDVAGVTLERNDVVKLSSDSKTIAFKFHNYGNIDGFDFQTICVPSVKFGFAVNGRKLSTSKIWVGSAGTHPTTNPFLISRNA